jgi:ankyrin repeat protein
MNKIIKTFLVCLIAVITNTLCMETPTTQSDYSAEKSSHNKVLNATTLLKNDGQQLKELLAIETNGKFSPHLLTAENILFTYFEQHNPHKIVLYHNIETLTFALSIMNRPPQRDILFSMLNAEDNPHKLTKIITDNPYLLNAYNSEQTTLLHRAVRGRKRQCITQLLTLKANPNCIDENGNSPLHIGIQHDLPIDVIENLLAAGAKPELINNKDKTPFEMACEQHSPNVKAFEKYGYLFFSTLWPYKNPFELLKDKGKYLKELAKTPIGSPEWERAENALSKLFNHLENYKKYPDGCAADNKNGFCLYYNCMPYCIKLFGENMLNEAWNIITERRTVKEKLVSNAQKGDWNELSNILKQYLVSDALQYELLLICIMNNNSDCLSLFLKYGFNPNSYHKQISPLYCAVNHRKSDAVQLLVNTHNIDLIPLRSLCNEEQTPLDRAIFFRDKQCTDILAKAMNERIKTLHSSESKHCSLIKHMGTKCTCITDLTNNLIKNQRDPVSIPSNKASKSKK